jgi:hypothetical protein
MKIMVEKIGLFLVLLFLSWQVSAKEDPHLSIDTVYLERVADDLVTRLRAQIDLNEKNSDEGNSSSNNYLVFGADNENYFTSEKINQDQGPALWNLEHSGISQVKGLLTQFNSRSDDPVKYYVLVASIYNFYHFEETLSQTPDWSKMPSYRDVKENRPQPYADINSERSKTFFFKVLKSKIGSLPPNNIVHIAASFYIPLPRARNSTETRYALFHHQAVSITNLETHQVAAIRLAVTEAERTMNSTTEKESWLSSAVDFAMNQYKNAKVPDSGGYHLAVGSCTSASIEEKIQSFANALNGADPLVPTTPQELANNNKYYFIIKPDGLDEAQAVQYRQLDDRLINLYKHWEWDLASSPNATLNDQKVFYAVIENIGCRPDNPELLNDFAKKVFERSNLRDKKAIVVAIPYYDVTISPNNFEIGKASIYDNTQMLDQSLTFNTSNNIPGIIQSVYKQVKKPHNRYDVYLHVNGSITHKENFEDLVAGYNAINEVNLWIKPEFHEFAALTYPNFTCGECMDPSTTGHAALPNDTRYAIEVLKYHLRRNEILDRAAQTINTWTLYQPTEKLREWCISEANALNFAKYQFEQSEFSQWLTSGAILLGASELSQACLADFNAMAVVDPVVYTALDVVSVVPLVDEVADGAGLLYATARGDEENAVIYAVSLTIPAVGGLAVKGAVHSGKILIKGVMYAVREGKIIFETILPYKDELKDLTRTLLKFKNSTTAISDVELTRIVNIVESADNQTKNQIEQIAKKDIADEAKIKELLASGISVLDELVALLGNRLRDKNLIPVLRQELLDPNNAAFKTALENTNELVDAWEILYKGGSAKRFSTATLETLNGYLRNNRFGWSAETFEATLENLLKNIREGTQVTGVDDEGIEVATTVGKTLSEDEFFEVFGQLNTRTIAKSDDLLSELCCESSWKFVGAEMVLRTVRSKNLWENIEQFEKSVSEINGVRYIDILLKDGKRIEVKSWKKIYPSFITQFVKKDLANAPSLSKIEWIFDAKYPGNLKTDITDALKSSTGRQALEQLWASGKLQSFFQLPTIINSVDDFITQLSNDQVFNAIFILQ